MKIIETVVYKFEELDEEAKQKAIENNYDINVNYSWWDFTYDDAKNVDIKINAFDIGRGNSIDIDLLDSGYLVASSICENHGVKCDTYNTSLEFIKNWEELVKKHSDGKKTDVVLDENFDSFDEEADELEEEFKESIAEDYLQILKDEYEYLTSEEAIKETLISNDYDFTEDGEIF